MPGLREVSPAELPPPPLFDAELLSRYDVRGPRYTSYPTAPQFHGRFTAADYLACVAATNADPVPAPLSLYFHIPFCRQLCWYCACTKVVTRGGARAAAYLERLCAEVERQAGCFDHDRRVEQLHWGGGTPTFLSPAQRRTLMATARRHFTFAPDDEGEFAIEVDPRTVTEDGLAELRALGFNRLSLGVQDLDPDVQAAIHRVQPEERVLPLIRAAREQGFRSVGIDLIYGLPRQSAASFERTLDRVIAARPERLSVYSYAHLPAQFPAQRLIRADELPDAGEKLRILQMSVAKLTAAGYRHIGMDHFAVEDDELVHAQARGRLCRNFQGYSTHGDCDIVGFGMSAISSVGDCYAQNARGLNDYMDRVDGGRLAIERGIRLSVDDLARRYVIGELICNLRLDLGRFEDRYRIAFWDWFAPERESLEALERDGLLIIEPAALRVPARGRLLVRNVCMVFDRYLRDRAAAPRYSRTI